MTATRRTIRSAAGLLAGGVLLLPLAACSDATVDTAPVESAVADVTESVGADVDIEANVPEVECSGLSCTLTLDAGQEADVLGTSVAFESTEDGVATVRVGGSEATCGEGEAVAAGPLSLECTSVSAESVTLTASLA